jgi:hypothetical protein
MIWPRARTYLAPLGIAAAMVVVSGLPGRAADRNPADELLDRSRQAVRQYEFRGAVRIWWHDATGGHDRTIAVTAVGGGLRVGDGSVLQDDGRAWMRADRQWTTLWADSHDTRAPSVGSKYQVSRRRGPMVVGRPTRLLDVRRHDRDVERIAFDRQTGLVLRRDRFDSSGAPTLQMQFVALTGLHVRRGQLETPKVDADAPGRTQTVPSNAVRSLSGGFVLVDARIMRSQATQLRYSDGVFEASVFTQQGAVDWGALPSGGSDVHYGSVRARRYRTPSGTVIVWQWRDRTLTCVTDATAADQIGILEGLTREHDTGWTSVVRFVTSPFSWT